MPAGSEPSRPWTRASPPGAATVKRTIIASLRGTPSPAKRSPTRRRRLTGWGGPGVKVEGSIKKSCAAAGAARSSSSADDARQGWRIRIVLSTHYGAGAHPDAWRAWSWASGGAAARGEDHARAAGELDAGELRMRE